MKSDEFYLALAFKLARRGKLTTAPNPNVGCVIIRDHRVVGEGYHVRAGEPHAEIHALRMAGAMAYGATAYITLEPCNHYGHTPPCTEALIAAGISRVVAAMLDPNPKVNGRGLYRLQQANIEVRHSIMLQDAEMINKGFLKRMRTGLPWIRVKLATSLDGRTAMASGESSWITSNQARQDVQRFRAESDAILSTSATVLADNPTLNVRWLSLPADIQCLCKEENIRQPIKVIIDSANRVNPFHRIIKSNGTTWLARIQPDDKIWPRWVEQIQLPVLSRQDILRIDLMALMILLGKRHINSVWVEAGANLAGSLLLAGLVDELILYMSPKLLGDKARPLCLLPGLERLSDALNCKLLNIRQVGPDIRICLKLIYSLSGS
ncbi:bifunctional diaminohydroxyphosphoribosylaminopyrimidine deaminase/5-amino-6-(5-phosphoribosylamino)uracil reductase RibD [Candidatus Palibaumannia cicadellinicola]|uniref:Riboflavin biosynthesis protein RibD n=1 Tax=Baumannia cicadellinicola subsp. Homalodisca coagulata TaxID=374463 RepID=Q1LSN6_BAUCH|nr:bifunctional diaminohydroxyphosphoribosylaminopyrimidine deaminase/5-amino-6-(5-phosphoribosylamino)uracil reductase RibD [Candidatus Baumannia cicadellinicola]ABF14349.1 riboflavin biosynthesis protein RibD [Baumannia cicadellinicola str. Hc (Homalodisca coagulata)]MCJ7461943.1 bifunctional diaminohydroxyphosphoribosylaminopyrimidine deaminase/5-amino-6-(5-phosphoribosylamino)uracil reductase RibD [Candidatus Baumannia cicadellinicola]MCJ7462981.1 bifunctional diaminohydroxyphosphoribosylami